MLKITIIPAAFAFAFLSAAASAQTTTPSPSLQHQEVTPNTPNSGAGIPGQPGNKNGPPADAAGTTGSGSAPDVSPSKKDASKVPGKPGGKSGPPVMPPSRSQYPRGSAFNSAFAEWRAQARTAAVRSLRALHKRS